MPKIVKKYSKIALVLGLILVVLTMYLAIPITQAATIANREIKISDSRPSQTGVIYDFEGDHSTTTVLCLQVQFCTTATGTCTVPTGMTTTSATRDDTNWSGWIAANWTIDNVTNGTVKYTYATGEAGGANYSFSTGTITNSSTEAAAFARVNTYSDVACTTGVDSGVAAFAIISGISVTATVAETLTFSIAAVDFGQTVKTGVTTTVTTTTDGLAFGELSTSTNQIGAHDLTVSTNATGGYTTTTKYTAALTSGANTITDHTGTNDLPTAFPAAGTEAWGYTTNDASLGTGTTTRFGDNNVWAGFTTSPLEIAYDSVPVSSQTTRTGYQAGISGATEAGSYSTTVIYICTPTY